MRNRRQATILCRFQKMLTVVCPLKLAEPELANLFPIECIGAGKFDVYGFTANRYSEVAAFKGMALRGVIGPTLTIFHGWIYEAFKIVHYQGYAA